MSDIPGVAKEIERKYLLKPTADLEFPSNDKVYLVQHGWLPGNVIHERITRKSPRGYDQEPSELWRTIKAGKGVERIEAQEQISLEFFKKLWPLTEGRRVKKHRHYVKDGDITWEVDIFSDGNLSLLEIELPSADTPVVFPTWLAPFVEREVTDDPYFLNLNLAR